MKFDKEFFLEVLKIAVPLITTLFSLWKSHKKTNENIENVENHLKILPGQINARDNPKVPDA